MIESGKFVSKQGILGLALLLRHPLPHLLSQQQLVEPVQGTGKGHSLSTQGCEGGLDSRPGTQVNRFFQKNKKCVLITPVEHLSVN